MVTRFNADGPLGADALSFYAEHGFLMLEGFASAAERSALLGRIDELVGGFDPPDSRTVFGDHAGDRYFLESGDKVRFFFEQDAGDRSARLALNKIGHALHDLDPVFDTFFHNERFQRLSRDLRLNAPRLLQSMVIFKQPGIGGAVNWHQDATFLRTEPESVTGFWIALEDATLENGCLQAIPGEHRGALRQWFGRGGEAMLETRALDERPFDESRAVALEAEAGTLIVLHGRLPHMSRRNLSAKSRCAVTLHVVDGEAAYPADNWLQRGPDMPLRGFDG